jgi:hypothetical protein
MNLTRKQIITLCLAVAGVLLLVTAGFYFRQASQQANPGQTRSPVNDGQPRPASLEPTTEVPANSSPGASSEEGEGELGESLANLDTLQADFSDVQYLYINNTVLDYARQHFDPNAKFEIDPISYTKRSSSSWGFSVRGNDAPVFYVIATKLDAGEIELKFFNGGGGA